VGAQFLHHVKPMDERALPKFETPLGPALGSLISKTPLGSFLRVPYFLKALIMKKVGGQL